jgi:hypothetical protein
LSLFISKYGAEFAVAALSFAKATIQSYDVAFKSEQEPALKELEIILSEPPKTNEFHIPFTAKDLTFLYQPPLTEEFKQEDCDVWTETHVKLKTGEERHRPENIVGSYAVYHASRKGNEYMTGKAFHIYRPEAVDAKGNRVWADMKIADGEIIISVPQKFLDSAVYPVVVDPTFGYTSIGGSYISGGQPWKTAGLFPLSAAGTLTKITAYIYGTGHAKFAVYSDVVGVPTTRQGGGTDEVTVSGANWYDGNYSSGAPTLTVTSWWLDEISDTNALSWCYDSGGTSVWVAVTYANEPITPFGSYSTRTDLISIYATYTTGGTLQTVTDSLGLSDSVLRHKAVLPISDAVGLAELILRHKTLAVSDGVGASDVARTDKRPLIAADALSLVDAILRNKQFALADTVALADAVSTPSRVLRALDQVGLADGALVNKVLQLTESISLVEVVEVGTGGAAKKTKLFLILGELALQLTGD